MLLVVINMFYRDFPSIPLILVITLQNKKTLFLHIFKFQEPSRTQIDLGFWSVNILSREEPEGEEVNETRPRGQTRTGGAGPCQAAPPILLGALSHQHHQPLSLDAHINLKMPIYRPPPQRSRDEAAEKHETQK
jgi:hypothetical protein